MPKINPDKAFMDGPTFEEIALRQEVIGRGKTPNLGTWKRRYADDVGHLITIIRMLRRFVKELDGKCYPPKGKTNAQNKP